MLRTREFAMAALLSLVSVSAWGAPFDLRSVILRPEPVVSRAYFASRLSRGGRGVLVGQPQAQPDCSNSRAYEFDVDGQLVREFACPRTLRCTFGHSLGALGGYRIVGRLASYTDPTLCGTTGEVDAFIGGVSNGFAASPGPDLFGISMSPGRPMELCIGAPGNVFAHGQVVVWNPVTGTTRIVIHDPLTSGIQRTFGTSVSADGASVMVGDPATLSDCAPVAVSDNCSPFTSGNGGSDGGGSYNCSEGDFPFVMGTYTGAAGAAYLFDGFTGNLQFTFMSPHSTGADAFGQSVALGKNWCAVGAPLDQSVAGAGAVYVFDRKTGLVLYSLHSPSLTAGGLFGAAVTVHGNLLFVGEPRYTFSETVLQANFAYPRAGAVHVYDLNTGALVRTIVDPTQERVGDQFGWNVVTSRNRLVVSSYLESPTASGANSGLAWVYDLGEVVVSTTMSPSPTSGEVELFGGPNVPGGGTFVWPEVSQAGRVVSALRDSALAPPGSSLTPAWRYLWDLHFNGVAGGPAAASLAFDPEELRCPEADLALAFSPSDSTGRATGTWTRIAGSIDTVQHSITFALPPTLGSVYLTSTGTVSVPARNASASWAGPMSPNPGVGHAAITFNLARAGFVQLEVFGVDGRSIRTLIRGAMPAGRQTAVWDGRDDAGAPVPPGVFLYRLRGPGLVEIRKLSVVR